MGTIQSSLSVILLLFRSYSDRFMTWRGERPKLDEMKWIKEKEKERER